MIDLRVFDWGGQMVRHNQAALYAGSLDNWLPFLYPPIAAIIFALLNHLSFNTLMVVASITIIGSVFAVVWLTLGMAARHAETPIDRRARVAATLALGGATIWLEPVQQTLGLGQVSTFLMLLVVADLAFADSRWCKGAIIGVATGLKLTPGLFIVYLLLTKRFRAAAVATTSFLATAAAGFAILPKQAIEFWSPHSLMSLSSRIGTAYVENQSFNGFFSRISATDAGSRPGWIISAAIGGIACMVIAVKAHQYCGEMGGMLVAAAATLLISPISWTHYWVWVIPAIAWLAYSIWTTDQGRRWKIPCLAGAYAIFLAYPLRIGHPGTWDPNLKLLPWGVIWLAPNDEGRERAWNQWWQPALGNLYIVIALIVLAATAVWLVRKRQPTISLPEPATPEPATPRTEEVAASEPESATSLTRIGPKPVD